MDPRPEVVQAIMDAQLEMNPAALAEVHDITPEERRRADEGIAQVYVARQPDEDRRTRVWAVLSSTEFARHGLDWAGIWDALADEQHNQLVQLYDVLPEQLLPFVDAQRGERSS